MSFLDLFGFLGDIYILIHVKDDLLNLTYLGNLNQYLDTSEMHSG